MTDWHGKILEPLKFARALWPDVTFYRQQQEIIYSVVNDDETFVVGCNMSGKDFVSAFIALWFMLSRHPVRVVTTSADYAQLESVLWGEIRRMIQTSRYPLEHDKGGPLVVNHLHIRKVVGDKVDGLSYLMGRVAAKGEGMLGHHIADVGDGIPRTLWIADEASGVDDAGYKAAETWARRKLVIGNAWPCRNFFYRGVKEGTLSTNDDTRTYRKVIRIRAEDSPNVRIALPYVKRGLTPPDRVIIPGVLPYSEYRKRRETWDQVAQCIGLDAEFYEGAEVLLYPPVWLNRAESLYESRRVEGDEGHTSTCDEGGPKAIGVDPGEGGANTCWCVVNAGGILDLVSQRTPDTSVIISRTLALIQKWQVKASEVCFDRGGGGKQIVDEMRSRGHVGIRTVAFGESVIPEPTLGKPTPLTSRVENSEERYAYFNRRAQMYGALRELLDPSREGGFAIPSSRHGEQYQRLRQQLAPIPLTYDREGRLKMPPKNRGTGVTRSSGEKTLVEIVGHSPDEADSLVLAVYAMQHRAARVKVGVSG